MKTKYYRLAIPFFLFALISLSCALTSKSKIETKTTENPPIVETAPAETVVPIVEDKEEIVVYEEGGFEFNLVSNWAVACAEGIILGLAPGADPQTGPLFVMMAEDHEAEFTLEEALDEVETGLEDAEIEKTQDVIVDGAEAIQADLSAHFDDLKIKAVVVIAMVSENRQFSMMAMAPADQWAENVAPHFEKLRNSIHFIPPVPNAGCPAGVAGPGLDQFSFLDEDQPELEPTEKVDDPSQNALVDGQLHQWASKARASSEYGNPSWAASQATGAPDVFTCTDSPQAWASLASNTKEWIELTYDVPVVPTEITVHMSYNPSQIVEIQIIDVNGKAYTARETDPVEVPYCPDAYTVFLELDKKILVNKVKIFLDQSILRLGWTEIDAVELVGYPEAGAALPPAKPQSGSQSGGIKGTAPKPDSLSSGEFVYIVSGYENDTLQAKQIQYQSTNDTYVVGLVSPTGRYVVSLFLPKTGLKKGLTQLNPYDQTQFTKSYTAAIVINAFLYIVDGGEIDIQSDPSSGLLTAVFSFTAHSKDFPDREIEVVGALRDVPLK